MRSSSENVRSLNGSLTLVRPAVSSVGLNSADCEQGDRLGDRGLALGRVQTLALRSGEDDVQHAALLGCELVLDQVGGSLRLRARNLELVAKLTADRSRPGRPGAR